MNISLKITIFSLSYKAPYRKIVVNDSIFTTNSVINYITHAIYRQESIKIRKIKYFMIMDSVFKNTLRSELDFQDVKVKELSVRTGISPRTLEGYLSSRGSIPPADVAFKIAQALNVSVEYLVTGNSIYNQKNNLQNSMEEKLSVLPLEKKMMIKDFIGILDNYEIKKIDR